MPFFSNIADLRGAGIKLSNDTSFDKLKAALIQVESATIKHILTPTFYKELLAKYESSTPSYDDKEEELVKKIQYAVAPLALAIKAPQLGISLDDSGVYKNKSNDKWFLGDTETANWVESLNTEGQAALEILIQFLEENASASVFPHYFGSLNNSGFAALKIKTAAQFSEYYDIFSSWSTFRVLRPILRSVQIDRIKPVLNGYYTTFLALTPATELEKDLVYHVEKALVYFTVGRALFQRKVSLTAHGVTVLNEVDRYGKKVTVTAEELIDTHKAIMAEAEAALSSIEEILEELAPEGYVLPESLESINDIENGIYFA